MIYRYCDNCGWSVRKKTYKGSFCPRCEQETTWFEDDIPASELDITDEVVDDMSRELLEEKGLLKPKKK